MTGHTDLPLFAWKPRCQMIAFPPEKRVGKIRATAEKYLAQRTQGLADKYAAQIDADLQRHFDRLGILPAERKRLTSEFWNAVRVEIAKQRPRSRPGGSAA
ncbi:MAG: hypothetical protein EOR97_05225 [Mesorhizobium sp.]|uniref:DUF6074 family protein n=1 Tax=Mesorhizobium sp. TaxID=1871066 RepID=UPI000FE5B3D1|nr:DUF6074 family protein [Mesorhizobium sp.]RWN34160.1 MAG: hypothetical protein EOR97_05225 [Mesorhizobium sp.]